MGSPPQRAVEKRGEDGGEEGSGRDETWEAWGEWLMHWGWGCCVWWSSRCFPGW